MNEYHTSNHGTIILRKKFQFWNHINIWGGEETGWKTEETDIFSFVEIILITRWDVTSPSQLRMNCGDSEEMKRLCTLGRRGRRTRRENQEKVLFCEWVSNIAFIRKWSDIASFFQVSLHLLFYFLERGRQRKAPESATESSCGFSRIEACNICFQWIALIILTCNICCSWVFYVTFPSRW